MMKVIVTDLKSKLSAVLLIEPARLNVDAIRYALIEEISSNVHPKVAAVVTVENSNFEITCGREKLSVKFFISDYLGAFLTHQ